MLTVTETVTRELTAKEKLALNDLDVFEQYLEATNAKDKKTATQYAKILLLKAMCMEVWANN